MFKKFIWATVLYSIVTMILGYSWYLIFFKDLYSTLGIYNREPPIIPLGFASMVIQGPLLAHLYPRYYKGGSPALQGIKFGMVMGLFLYSVSTIANAAKIQVSPISTWFAMNGLFHLIQFVLVGAGIGLVYGDCKKGV